MFDKGLTLTTNYKNRHVRSGIDRFRLKARLSEEILNLLSLSLRAEL